MDPFDIAQLSGSTEALFALLWASFLGAVIYAAFPLSYETDDEAALAAWFVL